MLELDGSTLTYEEFRAKCLQTNRPAIIRNAACAAASPSFNVPALMERLSPEALCHLLGSEHHVPVYHVHNIAFRGDVSDDAAAAENDHNAEYACEERTLAEVLRSWCSNSCSPSGETVGGKNGAERIYYLKDWHMQSDVEAALYTKRQGQCPCAAAEGGIEGVKGGAEVAIAEECGFQRQLTSARRHGYDLYQVPEYLGPDWMDPFCVDVARARENAAPAASEDMAGFGDGRHDYRFAYIGATNTWTVLHYDVFGTYSWSFNVCGDKLWFFPDLAGNRYLLQHLVRGFPTPPDIRVLTGFTYWTCVQHPGDLVFVPSRYFHQVHNIAGHMFQMPPPAAAAGSAPSQDTARMELTLAVNHNWCNQFCIASMVDNFLEDVDTLRRMIDVEDLRLLFGCDQQDAWRDHMDFMLQGGSNWSFKGMLSFLCYCERVFGTTDEGRVGVLLRELREKLVQKRQSMFDSS